MGKSPTNPDATASTVTLVVRRAIRATPERLFDAWTVPGQLKKWWGPASVTCIDATVDLRVGGRYRIANQFPDGKVVWIAGEFEAIERPKRLVYTWRLGPTDGPPERLTVTFEARGQGTEIVVTHERIPNSAMRDMHEQGWFGCLDGLAEFVSTDARGGA